MTLAGRSSLDQERAQLRRFALIVLLAFAFRLPALFIVWGRAPVGDPVAYLTLAQHVLSRHGLSVFDPTYGMELRAMYPPLYPLLRACIGTVLPLTDPTIFALNFVIDLASAAVIARLAAILGFKPLLPVAVFLLWPSNLLFEATTQKEGLAMLPVTLVALFAIERRPVRFGVASGLLALTQPALTTLPVIFALLLRAPILIPLVTAALVMLPWWVRNYLVFGNFVPLTSASGYSLWVGTFSKDGWFLNPPAHLRVGSELLFSRVSATEAWAWIRAHPLDYVWHLFGKLARGLVNGWWPVDRLVRMSPPMPSLTFLAPFTIGITAALEALGIFGAVVAKGTAGKLLLACAL